MRCDGLVAEVQDWAVGLEEVHARIAGAFARPSSGEPPATGWAAAVEQGAERVAVLPADEAWYCNGTCACRGRDRLRAGSSVCRGAAMAWWPRCRTGRWAWRRCTPGSPVRLPG